MRYSSLVVVAALMFGSGPSLAAAAETLNYPQKPVRLISAYAPGGGNDLMARAVGAKLAESLGQQVVVENRPGANSILACELTAKSAADGYTLLLASSASHSINPALYAKLPYDPIRDFTAVTQLAWAPNVLVVHPSVPAGNLKQLAAFAKARPGQLTYGSPGSGSPQHLAGVMFSTAFGIDLVHVPYRGAVPATIDLLAGTLSLVFGTLPSTLTQVRAGRLKAIAVTSLKRSSALPDVPTIAETLPGFEATTWYGIVGPAGIPREITNKLSSEIRKAVGLPDMIERFNQQGAETRGTTPEEFSAFMRSELVKWAKVVKDSGARAD